MLIPFEKTDEKLEHALTQITISDNGVRDWWSMTDDLMVYYTKNNFGMWAKCNECTEIIIGLNGNSVLRIRPGFYSVVDGNREEVQLDEYICSEEGYFSTSTSRDVFFTLEQIRKLKEISDVLTKRTSVAV